MKESESFGLEIFGDCAKIMWTPFASALAVGAHDEALFLDVTEYVG